MFFFSSEEKIIIKQSTPVYGTLGIIFGFIGIFILSPDEGAIPGMQVR